MALTQVRALVNGTWITLTYNDATGRYEAKTTFSKTSYNEPGGYFGIAEEVVNQNGEIAEADANTLHALRMVVRETTAPVLTLISPAPGYLQTGAPAFVFDATDEEGGSGVDPNTFSLSGASAVSIAGGYRFTWTPPGGWADGAHTITASVSDHDGNIATVSGAYIVDTVPPELLILKPDQRHVVDDESITVSGESWDVTTPNITVQVVGKTAEVTGGKFSAKVPLSIGENHIQVKVTDGAGNVTTADVYMIRLVTDRTENDVEFLRDLYDKPWEEWPEATQAWFLQTACLRGSYDPSDWNRVGIAAAWLAGELQRRGYIANVNAKTNWTAQDAPTVSQMDQYLQNVENVRTAQPLYFTEIPGTLRYSTYDDWNRIEKTMVEVDEVFPRYRYWSSGEISCGE